MTRKEWPLIVSIGGLVFALLVCIAALTLPPNNNKTSRLALEVAQQEYKRELSELDRKYEIRVNRLQEQINSLEFVVGKQNDLLRDELRANKRDIDDIQKRTKPR